MARPRHEDQVAYSRPVVEGLVEGEFLAETAFPLRARTWYELRSHVERTGRIDPGEGRPDADWFLTVIDLERAVAAMARTDPLAYAVTWLRMGGLEYPEIADVLKGRNVAAAGIRAQRWISDYLSGRDPEARYRRREAS